MANEVIKKDGSKQPFDPEKIKNSIKGAAARTELPEERQNEVVEQVATAVIQLAEGKQEIATSEIREKETHLKRITSNTKILSNLLFACFSN